MMKMSRPMIVMNRTVSPVIVMGTSDTMPTEHIALGLIIIQYDDRPYIFFQSDDENQNEEKKHYPNRQNSFQKGRLSLQHHTFV